MVELIMFRCFRVRVSTLIMLIALKRQSFPKSLVYPEQHKKLPLMTQQQKASIKRIRQNLIQCR